MQGLKVKCPSCTKICFETTDQFSPGLPVHGGMVRSLMQYQIDWLCSPTTPPSEMCCPECLAPLVVGGVLNVIMPAREAGEAFKEALVVPEGALTDEDIKKSQIPGIPLSMHFAARCLECGHEWVYVANDKGSCPKCGESNMELSGQIDGDKLNIVDPKNIEIPTGTIVVSDDKVILPKNCETIAEAVDKISSVKPFICDVCGKECKNQFGLNSHKKSHKTGGKK